ncbi:uncharacterized protein AMSG_02934 [Thecamonas trahens ATCC 50062]|uniref:Translin-associated factor X-interacting protein 1 N-terminal domain-containing protein n=1 Tax=Thecamonas trahens ATCC 50062 TaxID=461836 RepID=A0A0L0D2E1_THETB|nr:hypothetical protein AMSG_02934 [Thecamonas trahens ATCC 50062]KNC46499.1 hypothetical protein AMSG_02934 [Thecamonas trahens ATCC 50062]|eukprot:XP_013760280.1 hypothetical protein AMSG_02934 [Thecamonas trahens ATCC 50062]
MTLAGSGSSIGYLESSKPKRVSSALAATRALLSERLSPGKSEASPGIEPARPTTASQALTAGARSSGAAAGRPASVMSHHRKQWSPARARRSDGDVPLRSVAPAGESPGDGSSAKADDPTFVFRNERGETVSSGTPAIQAWLRDNPDPPEPRWYVVDAPPPRPATVSGFRRPATAKGAVGRSAATKSIPISTTYEFARTAPVVRPSTASPSSRGTAGGAGGSSGDFRSDAIELEVALLDALRNSGAESEGSCRIRRTVYSQLFEVIIERVPTYAHLLKLIKSEYDSGDVLDQNREAEMREEKELAQQIADDARTELCELTNANAQLREEMSLLRETEAALLSEMDAKDAEIQHLNDRLLQLNPLWLKQQSFYTKLREMETDLESTLASALVSEPAADEKPELTAEELDAADIETLVALSTQPVPDHVVARLHTLEDRVFQLQTEVDLARKREREVYADLLRHKQLAAGLDTDGVFGGGGEAASSDGEASGASADVGLDDHDLASSASTSSS